MTEFLDKIKKTIEQSLDLAKNNAQSLKDTAEELSKVARLKFDLHQLQSAKRRKLHLLGDTVYPFLAENKADNLKKHETLPVLLDEIKNLDNQIELTQKSITNVSKDMKAETQIMDKEELRNQITELEGEIESRIEELKIVKDALEK